MENKISVTLTASTYAGVVEAARRLVTASGPMIGDTAETKPAVAAKTKKKAAAPVVEMEDDEVEEEEGSFDSNSAEDVEEADVEEAEEEEAPPKKSARARLLSEKEMNTLCFDHATVYGRPCTLALLQKSFNTQSVREIPATKQTLAVSLFKVTPEQLAKAKAKTKAKGN